MLTIDSLSSVLTVICVLLVSSIAMGQMAFSAGLGVKRWAVLGLLIGPAAYPLLNTHKHFAWRRAVSRSAVSLKF